MRSTLDIKVYMFLLLLAAWVLTSCESEKERREREFREFLSSAFVFLVIVGGATLYFYSKHEEKRMAELQKQQQEAEREQVRIAGEQAQIKQAQEWLDYFNQHIFVDRLLIDSNIWMAEQYDWFFEALKLVSLDIKQPIGMPGFQFDEICNIKTKTKYGEPRNHLARLAIGRIERAQKDGWLTIDSISLNSDKRAYADPLLIKLIRECLSQGLRVCFISNDTELRIRVRGQIGDLAPDRLNIIEVEALRNCEVLSLVLSRLVDSIDSSSSS